MTIYEFAYNSIEEFDELFPQDSDSAMAYLSLNGHLMLDLSPGDMTRYRIGLQVERWPDLVGLAFYSPYNRAAIVPVYGESSYVLDKLRINTADQRYPGLHVIVSRILAQVKAKGSYEL